MHTTLTTHQQHTATAALSSQGERRPVLSPVWREVAADLDTPVSAYLKLASGRYGYLLESVEGGERLARYSFVGTDPYLVVQVRDGVATYRWLAGPRAGTVERVPCADPLDAVRAELERRTVAPSPPGLPRFLGGAVGYLSYEVAARYEPTVGIPADDPLGLPESVFMFSDTLLIFDHARNTAKLLTYAESGVTDGDDALAQDEAAARLDAMERRLRRAAPRHPRGQRVGRSATTLPAARLESRAAYEAAVERAKEYIRAGDAFQVVPSRRIARPTSAHP